ncbi:hypothetical protein OIU84_025460 [Salix udensis]|uniref:Uncharacterized protein n=1 Tax=Salix udensis TaxID=889485 RepID=A0AAD6KJN7_9ROSI|nr:hypothetical protein OIU84_025460 [Salix udensis]
MLKPAEGAGISPEKKEDDAGTETMPASTSERAVAIDVPAKARPQRANWKQARYVLSDSESEEDSDFEQASEDSDSD